MTDAGPPARRWNDGTHDVWNAKDQYSSTRTEDWQHESSRDSSNDARRDRKPRTKPVLVVSMEVQYPLLLVCFGRSGSAGGEGVYFVLAALS